MWKHLILSNPSNNSNVRASISAIIITIISSPFSSRVIPGV